MKMINDADKPASAYEATGTDLSFAKRGQTIIEYVADGLELLTGGYSAPLSRRTTAFLSKRVAIVREALMKDLENGIISQRQAVNEDDVSAFIFRFYQSSINGASVRKLRMIAHYAYGSNAPENFSQDDFLSHAAIVEQLSENELKAIAVLRRAVSDKEISPHPPAILPKPNALDSDQLKLLGLFESARSFESGCAPLLRFGFVEAVAAYGKLNWYAAEPLFPFLERVGPAADLE